MAITFKNMDTPGRDEIKAHPLADLFPMMDGQAFEDLVDDIRKNGLREPIVLLDNKIIDGRNRYKAYQEAGVEPKFEHYNGNDPAAFVVSMNLRRRHLKEGSRAMIAASLATMPAHRPAMDNSANLRTSDAAKMLNVSARSVETARAVKAKATSGLSKAVETGKISVTAAAVIADQPAKIQQKIVWEKDPQKIKAAVKELRRAPKAAAKPSDTPKPIDTPIAEQIRLQRQRRIVSLIIEGLGEREPELLNMLSEGDWDRSTLFQYLMEKLKERNSHTRKPGT